MLPNTPVAIRGPISIMWRRVSLLKVFDIERPVHRGRKPAKTIGIKQTPTVLTQILMPDIVTHANQKIRRLCQGPLISMPQRKARIDVAKNNISD